METVIANRHTHEIIVLNQILAPCWKGVVVLQDLALRFSHSGGRDLFIRSWHQQSNNLIELEKLIWELGGETNPRSYEKDERPLDLQTEPIDPMSLNRMLLLHNINHLTHLMHLYGEIRRTSLPFNVRMILQRHQLGIRETLEQLSSLYVTYPVRRSFEPIQAFAV